MCGDFCHRLWLSLSHLHGGGLTLYFYTHLPKADLLNLWFPNVGYFFDMSPVASGPPGQLSGDFHVLRKVLSDGPCKADTWEKGAYTVPVVQCPRALWTPFLSHAPFFSGARLSLFDANRELFRKQRCKEAMSTGVEGVGTQVACRMVHAKGSISPLSRLIFLFGGFFIFSQGPKSSN